MEPEIEELGISFFLTPHPEPDYPFDDLKENTPCKLHVPIGRSGRTLEATTAIAIPGRTFNDEFIPDEYAKVQLQVFHEGFESYDIDIPTLDGVSVLGDAGGGAKTSETTETSSSEVVTDKAEEPEMPKEITVLEVPHEISVPEVPMEISVPDVPMEITLAEPDVQVVASVGTYIEVLGLEWDGTELEVFEDPSPAKDPEVQEPPVSDKATDKSEVPRVVSSHNSKSKDDQKEKFMVTVFRGGKEHAKLREDDPKKAASLARKKNTCQLMIVQKNTNMGKQSCRIGHLRKVHGR
uniref:DUF8039 domain-containing protein n=1 Tax=Oryza sativa subsp. japonica TaxID=39947 RepID=Q2R6S6_ORYSJ|nr:hypothetical protein LOC_Os11g19020 [Oryza sativa Japonica Group]